MNRDSIGRLHNNEHRGVANPYGRFDMGIRLVNTLGLMAAIAIGLSAADSSIGTWKRNVEKSKYTPAARNPIKSQIMVREAVDGGVKVTTRAQRADGTPAIRFGSRKPSSIPWQPNK